MSRGLFSKGIIIVCILFASVSCSKKKEKKGYAGASLMKSETNTSSLPLFGSLTNVMGTGSSVQSFTPTTFKIPIYRVSLCSGNSSCQSVYICSANTVAGCSVELSKIDAFVDALNAGPAEFQAGTTVDHVSVQFCPDGDSSGIQRITTSGTFKIRGNDYSTNATSGLVAGTTAEEVSLAINGGCGSFYPIEPAVTIAENATTTVKMFFDTTLYTYGGISGGASNTNSYPDDKSCAGTEDAYVCAPVVTVVATVDSGNPTTEHYLITHLDESQGQTEANTSPTAGVVLYFNSSGSPIGGVQTPYRLSGDNVSWGLGLQGGLSLYPKVVDDSTVSFGEPEGSISLANWFKNFKRSTHTGTYTYSTPSGSADGTYKATKY